MKRKKKKIAALPASEETNMQQNSMHAQIDQISPEAAHNFIEEILTRECVARAAATRLYVAVDEIVANILQYSGAKTLDVACAVDAEKVTISFSDDGIPYDPLEREDPDVTLSAEQRMIGGLGIFMVKKTMDEVTYAYRDGRNILTIMKNVK